jgi:peptidoglycan hydrolase-like protein with peptidoglycan-binding domain
MLNRKLRKKSTASILDRVRGLRHITGRRVGMIVLALATALTSVAIIAPSASAATGCVTQLFVESNTYQRCVRDEQVLLNDLWYKGAAGPNQLLTVDGYYGSKTFSDVKSFQTAWNDTPDGKTGPETWESLCFIDRVAGFTGTYWHDAGCNTEPSD